MQHEILYRPSFSLAIVRMETGEELSVEAGAMVSMSGNISIQTSAKGGIFGALKRSVLGGESFFINNYKSEDGPGELTLASALPGDLVYRELENETVYVQSGSYIASVPNIEIDTKWGGAKTFFGGEGLFLLKVTGRGPLFISSYGAIHEVNLAQGEKYIVDTGHLVAFNEGLSYNVKRVGSWKSTLLSGEGLVCELTGPGKVFLQTRSPNAFLAWLIPKIPKRSN